MAARPVRLAAPAQDFHRPLLQQGRVIPSQQDAFHAQVSQSRLVATEEAFRSPVSQSRPAVPEEVLRSPAPRTRLPTPEEVLRSPAPRTRLPTPEEAAACSPAYRTELPEATLSPVQVPEEDSPVHPAMRQSLSPAGDCWRRSLIPEDAPAAPPELRPPAASPASSPPAARSPSGSPLAGGRKLPAPPPTVRSSTLETSPRASERDLASQYRPLPQQPALKQVPSEAPSAAASSQSSAPAKPARSWLLTMNSGQRPQVLRQQSSLDYPAARSSSSSQQDVPECLERAEAVWRQRLFEAERQRSEEAAQWEQRLANTSLELQLAREEVRCQRQLVFEAKTAGMAHAKALAWCGTELMAAREEARTEGMEQHLVEAAHSAVRAEAEAAWGHRVKDLECGLECVKQELYQARRSASAGAAAGGRLEALEGELREARRAAADAAACRSTAGWEEEVAAARAAGQAEEAAAVVEVRATCERALLELCDLHERQLREQEPRLEAALAQRDAELRVAREELACRPAVQAADTESTLVELCQLHDAELQRREAEFEAALASRDEELRAALEEKHRWQASRSLRDEQIRTALAQHRQAQAALNRVNEEVRSDLKGQRHLDETPRSGASTGKCLKWAQDEASHECEQAVGTDWSRKQTAHMEDLKAESWQRRRTESVEELEDWKRRPTASTAELEATDTWQHRPTLSIDASEVTAECTDD